MADVTLQGAVVRGNNSPEATEVTSLTVSVTVAAGADTAMLVCVGYENNGSGTIAVSSVTFNGDSLTAHAAIDAADWSGTAAYYRLAPDVVTGNVVVTMSAGDKLDVAILVADNVHQTTPLATAVTATGATGTSTGTQTVSGVVSGDLCVDTLSLDSNGAAPVQGADQTERWDYATAAGYHSHAGSTQLGSAGGAMSYTWTGSRPWSYIATALKASGGTPARAPLPKHRPWRFLRRLT